MFCTFLANSIGSLGGTLTKVLLHPVNAKGRESRKSPGVAPKFGGACRFRRHFFKKMAEIFFCSIEFSRDALDGKSMKFWGRGRHSGHSINSKIFFGFFGAKSCKGPSPLGRWAGGGHRPGRKKKIRSSQSSKVPKVSEMHRNVVFGTI